MKLKFILSLVLIINILSCCEIENEELPECIEEKIEKFKSEAICNSGAMVSEYLFQSQKVYVFENGNCIADGTAEVLNNVCDQIGLLGGIVGNNTINGGNFSEAELVQVLWKQG